MSVTAEALLRSALSDLEDTAEAFGYLAAVFEAIAKNRVAEDVDLAGAARRHRKFRRQQKRGQW